MAEEGGATESTQEYKLLTESGYLNTFNQCIIVKQLTNPMATQVKALPPILMETFMRVNSLKE